ncbi:biotin biosynthesis protein BioC [Shewanella sediminis HAW-EB3]|uniref:Biotin biosynthesis protein BioC n=1 Tax=Shewanella sediminis (strain HAW-EB3) TaxID=425104 RepID=A8FX08_SHESH|nr:methyltransferase domain-containing protein [Shewanella sediminis]ABV37381.1 biotin biosynthesis protein BioC [Shewanella sediminis HAW-EB3]
MKPEVVSHGVKPTIDESVVAERFSAAAKTYHRHNCLQKLSCEALFSGMRPNGALLDIGAGPGTDFSQFTELSSVIALDIAAGMLEQLNKNFPDYETVCADAKTIPLPKSSIDSVYSNLALQWCDDLAQSFHSTANVLRPAGEYHLAVVAQGSLAELTQLGFRANAFRALSEISSQFDTQEWQIKSSRLESMTVYFDDLKELLYSIKGVGASIHADAKVSSQSKSMVNHGIRGRGDWMKLLEKAEKLRTPQGIPLTYQIAIIRAVKR